MFWYNLFFVVDKFQKFLMMQDILYLILICYTFIFRKYYNLQLEDAAYDAVLILVVDALIDLKLDQAFHVNDH